jgi:hypothetical protein
MAYRDSTLDPVRQRRKALLDHLDDENTIFGAPSNEDLPPSAPSQKPGPRILTTGQDDLNDLPPGGGWSEDHPDVPDAPPVSPLPIGPGVDQQPSAGPVESRPLEPGPEPAPLGPDGPPNGPGQRIDFSPFPTRTLPTREQIAQTYNQELHRPIQDNEYDWWLGNANYAQEIANSPEAQAYRAGRPAPAPIPYVPPTTATTPQTPQDPLEFIRNWQRTHPASEGIGPLADALRAAGVNAPRYMYGNTPSNNELVVNGQKFKVLGAEDSPTTAFWYMGGNDSPPPSGPGQRIDFSPRTAMQSPEPGVFTNVPNGTVQSSPTDGRIHAPDTSTDPLQQAMRAALLKAMGRNSADVSLDDPTLKGQADAYQVAARRGETRTRAAMAERAAASGTLHSGGFDTGVQGLSEQTGENIAGYGANLVGQELQNRRGALAQNLALANAIGARTEAMQLQAQIADIDAHLRAQAMTNQQGQFYAGLQQNQGQYEDSLAYQYANLIAALNRQSMLAGLGNE